MTVQVDVPGAHVPPDPVRSKRRFRLPNVNRKVVPYLFLAPAIIAELLVHFIPIIAGLVMSFMTVGYSTAAHFLSSPWAGWGNYKIATNFNIGVGKELLSSFWVSLYYTLLVVAISWLFGFAASLFLQNQKRGKGFLRALYLIPYALPAFTAVMTFSFMYGRDYGLVNHFLVKDLHLVSAPGPFWLLGQQSFWSLVIVSVWRNWPFAFLVLMAGMQNIPNDLYEAASIDGAGIMYQIRKITVPMLAPVNQVLFLVLFLWNFNDFNTPFVLFGTRPPDQANLVSIDIYTNSITNLELGLGSAQSVLLLLFLLVVTGVYLLVTTARRRRNAI